MQNNITKIYQKIRKADKIRTLNLLLFLSLLIGLPLILGASQKKQNLQQNAQSPTSFPIYGVNASSIDGLPSGWTAKITYGAVDSIYDLYNKSPTYNGPNSISFTVTAPYAGLVLTGPNTIDSSPYNYLSFYTQGRAPGQRFEVLLIGADGQPNGLPVAISLIPNFWSVYNIPLTQFATLNKTMLGIEFRDANGGVQPPAPAFFDEISFSKDPAAAPSDAPPNNFLPTPTPEMPYYPNISPWVFIIPIVIIFFAVVVFQ